MVFGGDDELVFVEFDLGLGELIGEIEWGEGQILGPSITAGEVDAVDVVLVRGEVEMGFAVAECKSGFCFSGSGE